MISDPNYNAPAGSDDMPNCPWLDDVEPCCPYHEIEYDKYEEIDNEESTGN
jgi:hypothetical protein